MLPNDPILLMSVLNTKLRDEYDSLDALCEDMELDKETVLVRLNTAGFNYRPEQNQFRS